MDPSNDLLAALRDIHTPPPIGWWPLAPGWWGLLLLVICIVVLIAYWRKRRPRDITPPSDFRTAALNELNALINDWQQSDADHAQIQNLTLLMKRYVKTCHPPAAHLSGGQWLAFLDASGGRGRFQRFHHQLCIAPYRPSAIEHRDELLALVKEWMRDFPENVRGLEVQRRADV